MSETRPLTDSVLPIARPWCLLEEADLARLVARHEDVGRLCDQLEACADALPVWPTRAEVEQLCEALADFIGREAGPDSGLMADLFGPGRSDPLAASLMRHVEACHTADLIHAQDLVAALRAGPAPKGRITAETLGYMLRCFFEACRQLLVFEELAILALSQHRLTARARSMLVESLCRRAA